MIFSTFSNVAFEPVSTWFVIAGIQQVFWKILLVNCAIATSVGINIANAMPKSLSSAVVAIAKVNRYLAAST